jgi:hypothetical protein
MANYANTVLLAYLSQLADSGNKDFRAPPYGATRAFNDTKRDVIENFDELQSVEAETDLRTRQVDYLRRDAGTVNSTRAASLTGKMGTSTRDTITFVTYSREFTLSDDNARNNTQGKVRQLAKQMENARLDIGASIETAAITKLEAFKNQVDPSSPWSTWDNTNYLNSIANAEQDEYFNIIDSEMRGRDYNNELQIINHWPANKFIDHQSAQGVGNSSNLQYQYANKMLYTSNSITTSSDHYATSYAVETGSLGLVDWIPAKNREGLMNHGDFDFTQIPDPFGIFDRMALATEYKVQNSASGGANIGGNTQDAVWLYELSITVGLYISTITTQKLVNKYVANKS